jgi:hypothetical protein
VIPLVKLCWTASILVTLVAVKGDHTERQYLKNGRTYLTKAFIEMLQSPELTLRKVRRAHMQAL